MYEAAMIHLFTVKACQMDNFVKLRAQLEIFAAIHVGKNKFALSYFKLHWNTATNYDQMDKGALTYIALSLEVIDSICKE